VPPGDPTNSGVCCVEEGLLFADRGFDEVIEGYEDPTHRPLFEFLSKLSEHNMSFVAIGDSMTSQWFRAFLDELKRENVTGSKLEFLSPQSRSWYDTFVKPSSKRYLRDFWRWTSPQMTNAVYLYLLDAWYPVFEHSLLFGKLLMLTVC
jgi:hypothetical protein